MARSYGSTNAQSFASAPAVAPAGGMYYNSTQNELYVSDGVSWLLMSDPKNIYAKRAGDTFTGAVYVPSLDKTATEPSVVGTAFTPANGDIYGTTTSRAITVPAGTVAGDMLLLANTRYSGAVSDFTGANGFSKLPIDSTIGSTSSGVYWYRIADGTCDGGKVLTFTGSNLALLAMTSVRGVTSVSHAAGAGLNGASTPAHASNTGMRLLVSTYVGVALNNGTPQNATITSGETQWTISDPIGGGNYNGNIAIGTRVLQAGTSVPSTTWTQPYGHSLHVMTLTAGGSSPLLIDGLASGVTFGSTASSSTVPSVGAHLTNKTYVDAQDTAHAEAVDPHPQYSADDHTHPSETTFYWVYDSSAVMADPGSGDVRSDTPSGTPPANLAFHDITINGNDASATFKSLTVGDLIYFQQQDQADNWGRFTVRAAPTNNTTWWLVPVTPVETHGTPIAKAQNVMVKFTYGVAGGGGGGGITEAAADTRYVNITGDTMTGNLFQSSASGADIGVVLQTGSVNRWQFGKSPDAETGSNLGSEFILSRWSDAGAWLDNPIVVLRASGNTIITKLTLGADPTVAMEAATKQYVDTQRDTRVAKTGDTMTGQLLLPAGATGAASIRFPHGVAPSAPVNGDVWTTTAGLYTQINGATVGPLGAAGAASLPLTGGSLSGDLTVNSANIKLDSAGTAAIIIDRQATTNYGHFEFRTNGVQKWTVGTRASEGEDLSIFGTTNRALRVTATTSLITVYGDPTDVLGVATKQYVDARTPKTTVSSTAPSSPATGDLWVDTT